MEIFNYMSENAKKVLEIAASEARMQKQNFIGTEHILLGLLNEESDVQFVFDEAGITLEKTREYISEKNKENDIVYTNIISYTLKAKSIFNKNEEKARKYGIFKTEDLAIAILADEDSEANVYIKKFGIDPNDLKDTFEEIFDKDEDLIIKQHLEQSIKGESESVSILKKYTKNLCEEAKHGNTDPVIGRDNEIQQYASDIVQKNKE